MTYYVSLTSQISANLKLPEAVLAYGFGLSCPVCECVCMGPARRPWQQSRTGCTMQGARWAFVKAAAGGRLPVKGRHRAAQACHWKCGALMLAGVRQERLRLVAGKFRACELPEPRSADMAPAPPPP